MRQITIRGIPYEIEKLIKDEAKRKRLSINKAFISLLERLTGLTTKEKKEKTMHHNFDRFFGVWTKEEAITFDKSLKLQREIDEHLWKKQN